MRASFQAGWAAAVWALACWPVWEGYGRRLWTVPDQAWLFLAPLTAVALAARPAGKPLSEPGLLRWLVPVLIMIAYAAAFPLVPATVRAALAVAAFLFIPGPWRRGAWPDPAIAGLCLIGLPAVAMLQFYFGYPLRSAAAALAAPVLQGAGFDVAREGATLRWGGGLVAVDAACSGIRMGWAALYLTLAGAGLAQLGWARTAVGVAGAAILALLVNTLRVVVLFGVEAFGLGDRPFLHAGIGVMMFAALACGVVGLIRFIARSVVKVAVAVSPVAVAVPGDGSSPASALPASRAEDGPGHLLRANRRCAGLLVFGLSCLAAALVPFLGTNDQTAGGSPAFPGWPSVFEGRPIRETELGDMEKAFERNFPGRMGRFTDGSRSIVFRWVTAPTHRVHSGADCLLSFGWRVVPGDLWRDGDGAIWSTWDVSRQGRRMRVRERCYDDGGGRWADVSDWFWAATLGKTEGPWWVITVAEGR